jgi:hypothetical protein
MNLVLASERERARGSEEGSSQPGCTDGRETVR